MLSWYLVPKGAHLSAVKATLVASGKASSGKAGAVKIKIKLTAKGKHLLRHAGRLELTAKGAYTPTGANTVSTTKGFTLKR